jgi:beta-glucosidase
VQKNGVAACVKHFALNNQELWRDKINVEVSDRALYEIYLPAFKAAVTEGNVWAVMGSYNKFRNQYCCHNELLLNKVLKRDWNFDGVVISDWSGAHSTFESAMYGLDIEMGSGTDGLGTTTKNYYDNYFLANPFYELLKKGEIDESIINDKARRILRLMFRTNMSFNRTMGRMNNEEHHNVARKVANEGIVLLKNTNDFFPIKDEEKLTIAVIGENAIRSMTAGGGSSELKPQFEISPLEGLKLRYKNATILFSMGFASGPSQYDVIIPSKYDADSLKLKAIELAKISDIVLFVGGLNKSHLQDCEGADRKQFGLPFGQEELINELYNVNKNIGFILMTGNAVEMPWLNKMKGVIQSWYLGSMSGIAIADIISGDINPSGKLPFSFPVKLEDNAAHFYGETSYPGLDGTQYYKEDILVGYRWHDTKKIAPLFAFGYGLSYTSFELIDMNTDKKTYFQDDTISISGIVKNKGNNDGSEVIQVYIGKIDSKVERAEKELKGFQKVMVKKGENTTFQITIDVKNLSFYDESINDWNLEKGEYWIFIGNASNNISKKIKITVN